MTAVKGVTRDTINRVMRLYKMHQRANSMFPAINVNDSVTKSKFDNLYGCRHSLTDAMPTDVMLGEGCRRVRLRRRRQGAQALKGQGCRVIVTEVDPINALQAAMEGYQVTTIEDVVGMADIFVSATGNDHIITVDHMHQMKHNAYIVATSATSTARSTWPGCRGAALTHDQRNGTDLWSFPATPMIALVEGRLVNLGCATGHPSFVMSCSFSNQVIAQMVAVQQRRAVPAGRARAAQAPR